MLTAVTRCLRGWVCAAVAVASGACVGPPDPRRVTVEAQPDTPIVRNITNFTHSLRCMDDLFLSHGKKDVIITSDGLPDRTGQITTGTKEMMISALSRMTTKSGAFRFVDVDRTQDSVFWIQQNWIGVRDGLLAPNYYIRGAITQVDAGVMNDADSAGFSIPQFSLGISRDQLVSVISMDLNIGDIVTRQIKPGLSSTNSIVVVKTGKGGDTEGLIDKAGVFFEISSDRSQGSHQAVRTLVELGLIEVLGKLARVPYWRCLEIDSTNPEMIAEARDWFDGMSEAERTRLAKAALRRHGAYSGDDDDAEPNPELLRAVTRYQAENDLIADGRIDFDLYYSFLANNLAAGGGEDAVAGLVPGRTGGASPADYSAPLSPSLGDVALRLEPEGGRDRVFKQGDVLRFTASVAEDAHLYCYYEDHAGAVVRVFPSRFQDDSKVAAGSWIQIPSRFAGYRIVLKEQGATERMACVATRAAYGPKRPFVLDEGDLRELSVPDLQGAVDQHQDADRFDTFVQYLTVQVR